MRCASCDTFVDRDAPSCWLCHAPLRPRAASVPAASRRRLGSPLGLQAAPLASRNAAFSQSLVPPKPPAVARPRLPTLRTVALALATLALVALLCFGGVLAYGSVVDGDSRNAVHAYAENAHGARYTSRAGHFRAVFPTAPVLTTAAATASDGSPTTAHVIASTPGGGYTFSVRYQDELSTTGDATAALDVRTSQLAAGGRTLFAPADSTFGRASVRDIYSRRGSMSYRDRLILVDHRIYTIEVGSHDEQPEGWDRFAQSFALIPAA
jgi:hypothetical protein